APVQTVTRSFTLTIQPPGTLIFNSSFDAEPLGPLATEPNTDPLPLTRPTSIIRDGTATVDVIAPALGFTTRSVRLDGTPFNLASAAFFNPIQYFSGQARIGWSSSIAAVPPADATGNIIGLSAVAATESFPEIFTLSYDPSGAF